MSDESVRVSEERLAVLAAFIRGQCEPPTWVRIGILVVGWGIAGIVAWWV